MAADDLVMQGARASATEPSPETEKNEVSDALMSQRIITL